MENSTDTTASTNGSPEAALRYWNGIILGMEKTDILNDLTPLTECQQLVASNLILNVIDRALKDSLNTHLHSKV